ARLQPGECPAARPGRVPPVDRRTRPGSAAVVGRYVVSGSASGMGAATAEALRKDGHLVVGIDQRSADVVTDLSTAAGRDAAVAAVRAQTDRLDGVALFAGLVGLTDRPSHLLTSVNYFGSVALFDGLRPLLAAAGSSSALAVCSNSMTCQPGV